MNEHAVKIFALDSMTMDYFFNVPSGDSITRTVMESLEATGIWGTTESRKDKGTIPAAEKGLYTLLNRLVQDDLQFPKIAATAGGSAANTFTTILRALMGTENDIHVTFCCTVSDLPSGRRIRAQMDSYGNVQIYPKLSEAEQAQVISASSYIFLEGRKKKVAKAIGYGDKQFITPDHIREAYSTNHYQMTFVAGTAIEKFNPEVAETLVREATKQGSHIIFSLPTELTPANRNFSEDVINNHATIVMANMDELCAFYNLEATLENKTQAMATLQATLGKRVENSPSAIISDGLNGAYIIIPNHDFIHIPLWNQQTNVVDVTGAGDNTNAGYLTGLLLGHDNPESIHVAGHMGSAMSDAVIQQIGAQLVSDPKLVVEEVYRKLGADIVRNQDRTEPPKLLAQPATGLILA